MGSENLSGGVRYGRRREKRIAQFRFGVIHDLIGRKFNHGERKRLLTEKSSCTWEIPGSEWSFISASRILCWARRYEKGGCRIESLYTFHDFSGRWINQGRLTCIQWLSLIKLFELEVSVRKMSQQMGLSYRTVYRAVSAIRFSILSHARDAEGLLGGEIELDESYFGGNAKGNEAARLPARFPSSGSWRETASFRSPWFPT
ncbi:MAG: hypothetical protein LLG97_03810 [Deltaproteobacteria bacterium]|nr:hypothetical protein [Deltaproteobacteria bacterium]